MILIRLTFFIALAIFVVACDASPKVPNAPQKNYPAIIKDSTDRRAKAETEWRRMLEAYGVPQTPPDLYPIIHTPRSLLGVTGGIKIMADKPEPGNETIALREAMKRFIDRWRDLLGADLSSISLVGGDQSSPTHRLIYRQSNYSFQIAGNYGEMVAGVSADGHLVQIDDRFIPVVEMPVRPQIEREVAARTVVGRTFTYADIAGREQRTQVTNPAEVSVKQAVILPVEKGDVIEVHLAWEIVAGSSLSWTVYIDAINGEELKVVQNFQT